MLAAKLYDIHDLRLEDIPVPIPSEGEVLLKIGAVGICASDVHWYNEGRIGETVLSDPLVLGHEFAGTIAVVGEGVVSFKPGDRVAVEPAIHCGKCDMCLQGRYNICRNILFCGTPPTNGAFCEYLVWPARLLASIPDSISHGEAAMLEPMAIGVHAINIAGDLKGKNAAILGTGAVGLSILQAAKNAGCKLLVASDLYPNRLEVAKKLGADVVFNASESDVIEKFKNTACQGYDVVFEVAGQNAAVRMSTEIVKPGGCVVVGGIPDDNIMMVDASVVRRKELIIRLLRRSNDTLHDAIKLLDEGKVDVNCYITHRFELADIEKGFINARDNKANSIRVIIDF